MPTLLGVVFFLFGAYYFLRKEEGLLGLLIVASVFQGSSAITFGERGIQCFYLIETLIILRGTINRSFLNKPAKPMPAAKWLLVFGAIAVTSAFVAPKLFAGTAVFDPLAGIDAGVLIRPPLALGLNNFTQALFLIWHIWTTYSILSIKFSPQTTSRAFLFAFYLVAGCVALQAFCQLTGVPFPSFFIRNNPNIWELARSPGVFRKPATFLEPSFAGAYLVMCTVGFMAQYLCGEGSPGRVALSLLSSAMVTSSGSLLALLLSGLGLLIYHFPFRLPWYVNTNKLRRIAWVVCLVVSPVLVVLILSSEYRAVLLDLTISKGDSGSFANRTASDLYALQLLFDTHGIGVGLGSNRASSILTSLGSNVGIAGLFAFIVFCVKTFTNIPSASAWVGWAGISLLLNMCIDVPDVNFPVLWVAIIVAIALRVRQNDQTGESSTRLLTLYGGASTTVLEPKL